MYLSTKDPAEMTGDERISEVILILANALQRFQENERTPGIQTHFEKSLTGLHPVLKRSCVDPKWSQSRQER